VTDADPGDQPGRGRGNAGSSDSDPGDPVGQGRGAPPLRTGILTRKA
jgi:translation initiation factor IF-2